MNRFLLFFLFFLSSFSYSQKMSLSSLGLKAPEKSGCTSVKDQYMSSTCWSFSSNSFLESELMKMGKGKFDLSEMFIARYSMVRKIQRHLQLKGQNFFTPGGQFHDVAWVMKNYGMVPEEVYSGKARGEANHNHAEMDTTLSWFVKACVAEDITFLTPNLLLLVDSVLDHYYGKSPASFSYNGKTYTPKTYLSEYLGINPDDYLEITSYTHHPFYSKFVLEDKYNWTSDEYYNVPLSDFSRITDSALKNGYTVGWDGDAEDDYFDYGGGLAYLPEPITDFPAERQTAFENQTTLLNHMMHIVGRAKDKSGYYWYYIKNSWGSNTNSLGGFIWMREDYFKIRTVAIIVNKNIIPADIRAKMHL
ncbi:MAG TPA: C1 family peptidase [Chitinophagaceae bacterium]|nr:C1 family peptidase [Chitinophagaceae bacterium]